MGGPATIRIRAGKKSGVLHRACLCLIRQGYAIQTNRVEDDSDGKHKHITLVFNGGVLPLPQHVFDDLGRIEGCISIQLDAHSATPGEESREKRVDVDELLFAAGELLETIYGGATGNLMDAIVEATPPGDDPGLFIDQCKALVSNSVGDAVAEGLFRELHQKFA
jgi:hypothetical protein